jgi:uncharacterized membrane protein
LALGGCAIAVYLGLFQMDLLADVWEPFFGNGSRFLLKESALARRLPVPDALLGALVYLAEVVAESAGGRQRWRTWPVAVFVTGVLAASLAMTALLLVGLQVLWFRTYCTLCLASAACSLGIATLVVPEVRAAWRHTKGLQAGSVSDGGTTGSSASH